MGCKRLNAYGFLDSRPNLVLKVAPASCSMHPSRFPGSRSVFRRAGFGLDAGTTAVARSAREGNAIESLTEDGSGGLSLPRHLLHFACSSARCIGMAWPWFEQLLQNAAAKVLFCILTFLLSWGPNLGTYVGSSGFTHPSRHFAL